MTETAIVQSAELDTPVDQSTPAPQDDFQRLISEYEQNAAQPEPDPVSADTPEQGATDNATASELDQMLANYLPPDPKLAELQGQVDSQTAELNALKSAEHQRIEREQFSEYAKDLQSRLPDHVPPDYAEAQLLAAASRDPSLIAAWDVRNVPASERQQAPALLQQAIQLYQQLSRLPDTDPRKAQALDWVVQRGRYLEAVVMGPGILRKAVREIEDRAHKFVPLDAEASALRLEVAAAVRGSSAKAAPPERTNWGQLSANEGRQKVKSEFGFDPGWGH